MEMQLVGPTEAIQVGLWFLAGLISLHFSIGSARIWASISTGFFLIFISEGYRLMPWVETPRLAALHLIVGTIAIMALTHGFQEYHVFSRTLEAKGSKVAVYLTTVAVIAASMAFLLINPEPDAIVLRHIELVGNANWVFLSLINLDMIRKIYLEVRGTPIARGFIAFSVIFSLIFLWRGSELYLQVYGWDARWIDGLRDLGLPTATLPARAFFSQKVHQISGLVASISVGGTFIYLYRLLR